MERRGETSERRWKDRTTRQVQGQTEMLAGRGLLYDMHPVDREQHSQWVQGHHRAGQGCPGARAPELPGTK